MSKFLKIIAAALFAISLALTGTSVAQATPSDYVYFVAEKDSHSRVYKLQVNDSHSAVGNPVAITPASASRYVGQELATDNSYLYFTDNNQGSRWDIVRTDLSGANRIVLVSQVERPMDLAVAGVSLYFTTETGGFFRALSVAQSSPTLLIGPGANAGLVSAPTSGYGAFAIGNGKVVINLTNDSKLIQADFQAISVSNATFVSPVGFVGSSVTDMSYLAGDYIITGPGNIGYWTTSNITTDVSTWMTSNLFGLGPNSEKTYRYTPASSDGIGRYDIWSTGEGQIYHGGDMNDGALIPTDMFTGSGSVVAVFSADVPEITESLANTGIDESLVFLGLALLGIGLTIRRVSAN